MDSSSSTGLLNTILHPLIRRRKRKILITSATQHQVALVVVDNDICCLSCDLHVHLTLISGSELSISFFQKSFSFQENQYLDVEVYQVREKSSRSIPYKILIQKTRLLLFGKSVSYERMNCTDVSA